MSIASDLFDKRTDKLIANLEAGTLLDRDLLGGVRVYKSPQQVATENHVIFVWRAGVDDYEYSMGGSQVKITGTWNVAALTRATGDPAELERRCGILAANIVRHFGAHIQEAGYWDLAQPQASAADTVRTVTNQTWELELMAVQLTFEETL